MALGIGPSRVPCKRVGWVRGLLKEAPGRGDVKLVGDRHPERLVWPLLVVADAETVERALLRLQRRTRGSCGFALEGPMETLLAPILLRFAKLDALGEDAKPDPPHGELGEPTGTNRRKRRAVVRAHPCRQPELPEGRLEDSPHESPVGNRRRLAADEIAAVGVDEGERVADEAVTRPEVPLEVDAPDCVGAIGVDAGYR
jgi:hypothetical protein